MRDRLRNFLSNTEGGGPVHGLFPAGVVVVLIVLATVVFVAAGEGGWMEIRGVLSTPAGARFGPG